MILWWFWMGFWEHFSCFFSLFSCLLDFVNMWFFLGKNMYFEVWAFSLYVIFMNLQIFFGIVFCIVLFDGFSMDFWSRFFMIFRCFFKLFFDAVFQCFFIVFRIVCLTYANMNLVKNRWFFIVRMQIRFFAIDQILHQFSIRFWSLFASFFHYFSWLFWHRFLHRFFHRFLIENGSQNGPGNCGCGDLFNDLFRNLIRRSTF